MTTEAEPAAIRADIREKLGSHYAELVAAIQGKTSEALATPPAPGEWSALQQIEHLLLSEGIWTAMIERALAEDGPDLSALWSSLRRAEEPNPFPPPAEARAVQALLPALSERHARTLALLDSAPGDAFVRLGRKTGFGDLTVQQMFRAVYRHHRMHIDQVEGREPSFQPRRAQP